MLARTIVVLTFIGHVTGAELPSRRTQTNAQGFYRFQLALGDDYFDGKTPAEYHRATRHLRLARSLGIKYLRCAFSWNAIETAQGKYDWKFWDHIVAESQQQGIVLLPYVAYTPEWAARSKGEFWRQPPSSPELFASFMRVIAARYRGRIASWELWNEPDLAEYWTGTVAEFAELIRLGAAAVREADPTATIVLGGLSNGPSPFFKALLKHHSQDVVDVVAMHGYPESWHEERAERLYYDRVREMADLLPDKDIWLNESGYPDYRYRPAEASVSGVHAYYRYEHSRAYQAVFLFKMMLMSLAHGKVSMAGWYRIDDFPHSDKRLPPDRIHNHLGIIDVAGRRKPTFFALRFFTQLFNRPTRAAPLKWQSSAGKQTQTILESIEKDNGELVIAGWLRSSEYDEVRVKTGRAVDRRREVVSVVLPCTEISALHFFDALGNRASNPARSENRNQLRHVLLTGDRVFIASMLCHRD